MGILKNTNGGTKIFLAILTIFGAFLLGRIELAGSYKEKVDNHDLRLPAIEAKLSQHHDKFRDLDTLTYCIREIKADLGKIKQKLKVE